MGRWYGEEGQACFEADLPRADDPRIMDDRTGNAAKDGYTRVGSRRPWGNTPGDMVSAEDADAMEEMNESYGEGAMFWPY